MPLPLHVRVELQKQLCMGAVHELRGCTHHALRLVMQLPMTSHLTSGNFSKAEASFIGVVRRCTLIRSVTKSCYVH